jgi:hypothetical protein
VFQVDEFRVSGPQLSRMQQDVHHDEEEAGDSKRKPSSVGEFAQV